MPVASKGPLSSSTSGVCIELFSPIIFYILTFTFHRFNRPMLMFGCRHHIADLLVKNVYYAIMKADPSPENQMFKRFRDNFRYVDTSGPVAILEVNNKDELVSFYTDMLLKQKKDGLPRGGQASPHHHWWRAPRWSDDGLQEAWCLS